MNALVDAAAILSANRCQRNVLIVSSPTNQFALTISEPVCQRNVQEVPPPEDPEIQGPADQ